MTLEFTNFSPQVTLIVSYEQDLKKHLTDECQIRIYTQNVLNIKCLQTKILISKHKRFTTL